MAARPGRARPPRPAMGSCRSARHPEWGHPPGTDQPCRSGHHSPHRRALVCRPGTGRSCRAPHRACPPRQTPPARRPGCRVPSPRSRRRPPQILDPAAYPRGPGRPPRVRPRPHRRPPQHRHRVPPAPSPRRPGRRRLLQPARPGQGSHRGGGGLPPLPVRHTRGRTPPRGPGRPGNAHSARRTHLGARRSCGRTARWGARARHSPCTAAPQWVAGPARHTARRTPHPQEGRRDRKGRQPSSYPRR